MILHMFNKPAAVEQYLRLVSENDVVVLLEDGVYARCQHQNVYAIDVDVKARAVPNPPHTISNDEFVKLCCDADKVCSWF